MTNDEIKSFLHLHEVDHGELMNVLLHHFSSGQHPDFSHGLKPAPLIYKFQAQNSPHSIGMTANEDGQIVNIQFSDGSLKNNYDISNSK